MNRLRHVLTASLVSFILSGLAVPRAASAQEGEDPPNPPAPQAAEAGTGGSFGVGFQSSWPAYGISGLYDVNETLTAQAVLGAFGSWTTLSGRMMYNFQQQPSYNLFGVGAVGMWRYSFLSENETSLMIGGGAGVELNWQRILGSNGESPFPPLYSNLDITLTFANFDNYSWNALTFGAGLHYRF